MKNNKYPHITISSELDKKIKDYSKRTGLSYSNSCTELIEYGFFYLNKKNINKNNDSLNAKIMGNEKYIIMLLEQLYADMYIMGKENPKENRGLEIIKSKFFKRSFDE